MNNPSKSSPESPAKEQPGEQKLGQGWIPLGKRLPEPDQRVIVYEPSNEPSEYDTHLAGYLGGKFYVENAGQDGDSEVSKYVTHWMPLPPPPERP